jgi:hypothetical protein
MALTRVIASLPYWTDIPEDVCTNTFYFGSVAVPDATAMAGLANRLDAFYNAVDQYMSPVIKTTGGTYRFYNMADPEPRTPMLTLNVAALALGTATLPEEVSICLSYYAAPASGQPANRRRGRIFIGPLAQVAMLTGGTTSFSQPAAAARTAIAGAAAVLADQSEPYQWCVYSVTDQQERQIVGGWVDNSFDTQRRRGRRPTSRNTWLGQP